MNVDVSETIKERIWISDLDSVALYAAHLLREYGHPHSNANKPRKPVYVHCNAHKPPKHVTPTISMLDKKF